MTRCDSCGRETSFLSPQKDCLDCAKHDPLERAAIEFYEQHGPISLLFPWAALSDKDRDRCRHRATAMLTAAVDVKELAEHIGPDHAAIVGDHLLGSQEP